MSMVQCEQYAPFWEAHRDNWKPSTPADVWGLREDREFEPPSRAHVKRIERVRPVVVVRRPVKVDTSVRADLNRRVQLSKEVLKACGCERVVHVARPVERFERVETPRPYTPADRAAQRLAEAARLMSYGMITRESIKQRLINCLFKGA